MKKKEKNRTYTVWMDGTLKRLVVAEDRKRRKEKVSFSQMVREALKTTYNV